jgi:hypothetical protein
MVAVTFEVVSLRTNTLSESEFSLPKTFLELSAWWSSHVLEWLQCLKIRGLSKRSSVLGIAKSRTGPNLASMVDGPSLLSIFWPKTPGQRARHKQGYCHDATSKHQAKVQVFSDEQPHLTLPVFPNNNAGSLSDLVQETQSAQFSSVRLVFGRPGLSSYCNTRLCNTSTASLLPPHLLHQHTRHNHRHVVTRRCLVITHSLFDATYMQAFRERNCQTSYTIQIPTVFPIWCPYVGVWQFLIFLFCDSIYYCGVNVQWHTELHEIQSLCSKVIIGLQTNRQLLVYDGTTSLHFRDNYIEYFKCYFLLFVLTQTSKICRHFLRQLATLS